MAQSGYINKKLWLEEHAPSISAMARRIIWRADRRGCESRKRLRSLHNSHYGERCFIIGNGPSLLDTDLGMLADEITFSLNRGYLYYDRIGKPCSYHVAVNKLVVEQFNKEIAALPNIKFVTWGQRHYFNPQADVIYISYPSKRDLPRFSIDPTRDIWPGATVTYVALQLAYYLGFSKVILIGVDHRFHTKGKPHKLVVSTDSDKNHFDPNYFGKGVRWNLPDLETSEMAYMLARYIYSQKGRQILDATIGGALTIFPKVKYEELFS